MPGELSRRGFIGLGVAGAAVTLVSRWPAAAQGLPSEIFVHGVASGDPLSDRVILWTRVTPSVEAVPGSGLGPPVEVGWEVAREPAFTTVVARGTTVADPANDHTVHVDAVGLEAGVDHWYHFHALGSTSPIGRTRTAPATGASLESLRLGIVTCAEWEFGFFSAYRHLAARDDVDAILHLGDYIYEFGIGYGPLDTPGANFNRVHDPVHETVSLADYRTRYGQYHRDPDLQALHAAHPMIAMYDDHEVANDAWNSGAQNHNPDTGEGDYAVRASAARQAWREWLPVRPVDPGDAQRVYRSFQFGDLADLWMLDERQYRDKQPANALFGYGSIDPAINDPDRTLLGGPQEQWLHSGLSGSIAVWKVLGNPVPFLPINLVAPALPSILDAIKKVVDGIVPVPVPLAVEDWNGYVADRNQVLDLIKTAPVPDVVILTGDYHESFASEVPFEQGEYLVDGNSAAVEFVAPAATSPGLEATLGVAGIDALFETNLAVANQWVKFHDGFEAGFGVIEFNRERAQYDFWFISERTDPRATAAPAASWQTLKGTSKLTPAAGPLGARDRTGGAVAPAPVVAPAGGRSGGGALAVTGGTGAAAAVAAAAAAAALAARAAARNTQP